MRVRTLAVAVGLAAPLVSSLAVLPAGAEAPTQSGSGTDETLAPTMLVLDASGSMRESDPSGGTRMGAAKKALHSVVDQAPSGAELGLMAYGTTPGKVANDLALGCEDINTLREVGPVNQAGKGALTSAIDEIDGNGYTPIGASLEAAAEELPAEGPRAVVLVSDGEDTCAPPPPCEVAEKLKERGVDLVLHTVGFQVGDKAREELRCIAEVGDGSYVDAPDADTLRAELPKVAERAWRSYELDGAPVRGTAEIEPGTPAIGPGRYVDQIETDQTKYYRFDAPGGFSLHGSATAVIPREGSEISATSHLVLYTRIVDENGNTCSETRQNWGEWLPIASLAASVTPGEDTDDCASDGPYYLQVEREGPAGGPAYDLELQVILEPPVTGEIGPSGTSDTLPFSKPGGEVRDVTGGAGFNDATELPSESGRYADEIGYGEITTYKVWLDWGQSLGVRAHAREGNLRGVDAGAGWLYARVYGPTRDGQRDDWLTGAQTKNQATSLDPIVTPPVYYDQRNAMSSDLDETDLYNASYLPGWHYINVWFPPYDSDGDVPVEIEVSITGREVEPPEYEQNGPYPAKPIFTEGDLDPDGGDSEGSPAPEASKPAEPDDSDGSGDGVEDDTTVTAQRGSGSLPWVLGGVGGIVLVGLTAGLLLARRRSG